MDLDSTPRSYTPADERNRVPQAQTFRRDIYEGARHKYGVSYALDQGPGPATVETTPPRTSQRSRPRFPAHVPAKSTQDKPDCLTAQQTIDLFAERLEQGRAEAKSVFSDEKIVPNAIRTTLTIDLGRERIERLPDAVIDLIIVT